MKVLALAAITIDGKIARKQNELANWTSKEDKKLFSETTKAAGVIVVGRTTYETFPGPLKDRLHIVLTSKPEAQTNVTDQVEFVNAQPRQVINMLQARGFSTVVIAGGASVYAQYLQAGVIDELWLTIEPKVFGEGIDLFGDAVDVNLELIEQFNLNPDVILIKYKILK